MEFDEFGCEELSQIRKRKCRERNGSNSVALSISMWSATNFFGFYQKFRDGKGTERSVN